MPRLQLFHLSVLVEADRRDHVSRQDLPEQVDEEAAQGRAMQEVSDPAIPVFVPPDARAEPGQEPNVHELLEPLLQRRHVRRRHPHRALARGPDDHVDTHASGRVGVCDVPGGLGAAEHRDVPCALEARGVVLEVLGVEEQAGEGAAAGDVGHVGLGCQAGRDDQLLGLELRRDGHGVVGGLLAGGEGPAAVGCLLGALDGRIEAYAAKDAEVLGILREILMQDGCGDVLAGLDAKRGAVHGEIGVLVRAQHVIRPQARVETVFCPHTTHSGRRLQDKNILVWM